MSNNRYGATGLTGGTAGDLDNIDGAVLAEGDQATVTTSSGKTYEYRLDASSAAAESSPTVISPDDNAGDKRWILTGVVADNSNLTGTTTIGDGCTITTPIITAPAITGATTIGTGATITTPIINEILAKAGESGVTCVADGDVALYYDDAVKMRTIANGIEITDDGFSADSIKIGFYSSHAGYVRNGIISEVMNIEGTNSVDATALLVSGDPDGGVSLYYDNTVALATDQYGIIVTAIDGDGYHLYEYEGTCYINLDQQNGYLFKLTGKNDAGDQKTMMNSDPDGAAALFYTGTSAMATTAEGISVAGAVKFPATQSASADANSLDDYEEGTWTPTITFGGAAVDIAYTTQQGFYIKIGRQVTVNWAVILSDNGSSTGDVDIRGLPFVSEATVWAGAACNFAHITSSGQLCAYLPSADNKILLRQVATNGVDSAVTNTEVSDTGNVIGTLTYYATD